MNKISDCYRLRDLTKAVNQQLQFFAYFVFMFTLLGEVHRIPVGLRSNGVKVSHDGRRVYISNGGDGNVSVIDTATNTVIATVAVGQRPWNMALTPDGKKLYVANGRSNSVSVIDTTDNKHITDIPVGNLPWGVVIH
ncbi:MAG: beta-propeller fold lactonase family protein [Methylotenera sp.]|nr:beta-propeller fold lactonase family protein [Methylotenera sp.]